jgi:hypothetical protein
MRPRYLATLAAFALVAPSALLAAPAATAVDATRALANSTAHVWSAPTELGDDWRDRDDEKHCGRGRAWGCRRNRDDRDDDHDRYDRDRYDRDRYERARHERERYERERYARERYERDREDDRYRRRDRRNDGRAVVCIHTGTRVIGSAVIVICLP